MLPGDFAGDEDKDTAQYADVNRNPWRKADDVRSYGTKDY